MDLKERKKIVQEYRLIDDVFFEVFAEDIPAVTKRFNELKSEGGASAVCEIMERYLQKERIAAIQKMIKKGYGKDEILDLDYTEEEYSMAEKDLKND